MESGARSCDVLVVGGGVTGVCAAVSAARQNARTLLVERSGHPGGTGTAGMHRSICGLYPFGEAAPFLPLNGGLTAELCARLNALTPDKTPRKQGRVIVLPFTAQDLVQVLQDLCRPEARLTVQYNTSVISVTTDRQSIVSVTTQGGGITRLHPKTVVDCTGDGTVVKLSGAPYRSSPPERRQLSGYAFKIRGLRNIDTLTAVKVPYHLNRAVEKNELPFYFRFTTFAPGDKEDEGVCRLNIPPPDGKHSLQTARTDARRVFQFLARTLPEFTTARIDHMAPRVVDREGLRMQGRYTLHSQEVLVGKKFSDGHVRNAWPIEMWDPRHGPTYRYLEPGDHYEIPDGCLQSATIHNLFAAGRCISVSHRALGSTRVMGTCMALGERAGLLAAMAR